MGSAAPVHLTLGNSGKKSDSLLCLDACALPPSISSRLLLLRQGAGPSWWPGDPNTGQSLTHTSKISKQARDYPPPGSTLLVLFLKPTILENKTPQNILSEYSTKKYLQTWPVGSGVWSAVAYAKEVAGLIPVRTRVGGYVCRFPSHIHVSVSLSPFFLPFLHPVPSL